MNLQNLKREIPYKYKPQSVKYGKAIMVSYIDARDAQDLLDEVVGPDNWQSDYKVINENLYAGIGIRMIRTDDTKSNNNVITHERTEWVWKWDCGVESNQEAEKGEASDAFKRAAVQWGIGRFLYRLGVIELPTKEYNGKERPCTKDGKILWGNDEISNYIRNEILNENKPNVGQPSPPPPAKKELSEKTLKRMESISKEGIKGKECIKKFLPDFNKAKGLSYKLADLTEDRLNVLMDFIDSIPPKV
jgi:hypothetical protein